MIGGGCDGAVGSCTARESSEKKGESEPTRFSSGLTCLCNASRAPSSGCCSRCAPVSLSRLQHWPSRWCRTVMPFSEVEPLLSVLDHSTVLPPSEPLRRLLNSLDKHHLIQIVLCWIHQAQHSPSPNLHAPQLSRRASRRGISRSNNFDDAPSQDHQRVSVSSFLDLHEERRARSYVELTTLWLESMSEAKIPRARAVDRILNVDWPSGLTYAMVATLSFELIRASPVRKVWHTYRLDFGDDNAGESSCE